MQNRELERYGHSSDCKPYSSLGILQNRPDHRRMDPEKGSIIIHFLINFYKGQSQKMEIKTV
jgi:hypothetical protein